MLGQLQGPMGGGNAGSVGCPSPLCPCPPLGSAGGSQSSLCASAKHRTAQPAEHTLTSEHQAAQMKDEDMIWGMLEPAAARAPVSLRCFGLCEDTSSPPVFGKILPGHGAALCVTHREVLLLGNVPTTKALQCISKQWPGLCWGRGNTE